MNRKMLGILIFAASTFTAALRSGADDTPAAPSLPAVAASVNGENISSQEWLTRVQQLSFNDFNASVRARRMTAGQLALEQLINERVILQYGSKVGLIPSDGEIDRELEAQKAQPAIKERLDLKLISEAQLRYAIRYQRTLQSFITINQNVSAEEVRAYYDAAYARKWQVALIRTAKKETAAQAYADLQKGEPFAAEAVKLSEDPDTKKAGGELRGADGKPRWIGPREPGIPPFIMAAISNLKNPGDYTQPIEGSGADGASAWFILQLLGKYKSNDEDFNRMKAQVEREALFAKAIRSRAADKKLNDARKEAKITVNLPGYQLPS